MSSFVLASRPPLMRSIAFLLIVVALTAPVGPAAAARHPKKTSSTRKVPRLAPSLRRMIEEELGPGWPETKRGTRQLERERGREEEGRDLEATIRTRPAMAEHVSSIEVTTPGLAADALVNDKTVNTCSACQSMPIAQDEASIAIHGDYVVTSFNDIRNLCGLPTRQNVGFSIDGGATFVDGNGIPKAANGGNLWGDPSAAVNHKTGEFYIGGLYATPSGVGATRGHFDSGTFVWDGIANTVATPSGDFFDKPWMTVDSLSGNVYFTWANFTADGNVYIQFARCDASLVPIGSVQTLNDTNLTWGVQYSQMAVGPGGVLYAIWLQFYEPIGHVIDSPCSVAIRRSDDFGATWGPITYASPIHSVNDCNGGPGFLRTFASLQPTIAVDNSNGPHRGRVYVAWDEALDFTSMTPLETTTRFEAEPNDNATVANLLIPGGKLRGTKPATDEDWFRIDMNAGDTFYMSTVFNWETFYDSTREGIGAQIYSPDLSGTLHLAANGQGTSGSLLYAAPRTASYYMRLYSLNAVSSPYILYTTLFPAGTSTGPALDSRDQLMAWSDDGISWSAPARMNDSPPGADAQYPSITVDGRGRVYCGWMDWRDDHESGTASTEYMAMSGDGGVTWGPNVRAGDAVSGWSTFVCQSNGNTQGDYQLMAADGDRVALAFTDSRLGDPDIFVDVSKFSALATGPAELVVEAGRDTTIAMSLANQGNFARELSWRLEDTAGWLTGGVAGTPTITAGNAVAVNASIHPTGAPGDSSIVHLIHSDLLIPGFEETSTTVVRITAPVGVPAPGPAALRFAPPEPNPSGGRTTLRYELPAPAHVDLTVYSVQGDRVRTLEAGPAAAGPHVLAWDGRDARGRAVAAGVYLVRLRVDKRSLTRRVVVSP
jgi:FlgD Ig-like domain